MDFIKMNFIKDYLFALIRQENTNNYSILFGKIIKPKIEYDAVSLTTWLTDKIPIYIPESHSAHIDLTFITKKDNTLYYLVSLNNEEEYNTIIKILEVIL